MKSIKAIIPFMLMWVHIVTHAQCYVDAKAFDPGETLKYGAYYNWGFIWLHAGEVEFTVTSKKYEGLDVDHLYAYGTTIKSYDRIFRVRDKYQSYVDPQTLQPLWYERDVTEGNYTAFEDYKFDYENNLINTYVQKRKNPGMYGTLPLTPCLFDVMSAIYYFRSVDFSKYSVGDKIPINMVLDSESYNLYMRYLGKEEVKTRNKKKYKCLKFAVQLVEGSVFKGDEDAIVWVTDDKNKIPVIVEAKIIVGSVKAILTNANGLKF
jgi:hypothetical protein